MASRTSHEKNGGLQRKRNQGDARSPGSIEAEAAREDAELANERRAQQMVIRQKDRIQSICAQPREWSTKELRETAKTLNLPNTSSMSKKGLCELLAKHYNMNLEKEVEDEDIEYPAGFFDLVSQGPLYDPIIASDGFSYNRASLRNLFKTSIRTNRKCFSLHNPQEVLKNPFTNIVGVPQTWPLIENKSLKLAVEEWMIAHGLTVTQEERDAIERTPTVSKRDDLIADERGGMMANGIYFIPPAQNALMQDGGNEEEEEEEEVGDEESEDEEVVYTFVPKWLEDDIDSIVFSRRAIEQGINPVAIYASGQNGTNTTPDFRRPAGWTTIEWVRHLLLLHACVVVDSIAVKDVLMELHIPASVVVLDKETHKVRVFNKHNVEERVHTLWYGFSNLIPVTYMLEAIVSIAWKEPVPIERNIRAVTNVAETLVQFIHSGSEDVRQIPLFLEANIGLPIEEEVNMTNGVAYGYLPHGQFERRPGQNGRR
jgi:hypothetical protein